MRSISSRSEMLKFKLLNLVRRHHDTTITCRAAYMKRDETTKPRFNIGSTTESRARRPKIRATRSWDSEKFRQRAKNELVKEAPGKRLKGSTRSSKSSWPFLPSTSTTYPYTKHVSPTYHTAPVFVEVITALVSASCKPPYTQTCQPYPQPQKFLETPSDMLTVAPVSSICTQAMHFFKKFRLADTTIMKKYTMIS